ncbi:MAG: ABC transporter permease subunit, partial [Spirochaetales bacterium]
MLKSSPLPLLLLLVIGFGVFNLGVTLLSAWQSVWWLILFIDFVLLVIIAELLGKRIAPRYLSWYRQGLAVTFPFLLFVAWELLVREGVLNPDWFPPPTRILQALWDLITRFDEFSRTSLLGRPGLMVRALVTEQSKIAELLAESHLYATLMRVFVGFFLGAFPGLILGMVMGISPTIRIMIDATLSAFYVLPKIAIFPIMMLIFPDPFGEGPKIAVVAISVFFLVTINTMVGVRDIESVYLEAGRNFGARGWKLFFHVILPGALPVVFAGLRLALGTALIVI